MKRTNDRERNRLSYSKPKIERVQLKLGEMILGGCKAASNSPNVGSGLDGNCALTATPCLSTVGS